MRQGSAVLADPDPSEPDPCEETIRLIYRAVLRRESDEAGLAFYAAEMRAGRPVASILEDFIGCEEFRSSVRMFAPAGHFYSPVVDPTEAEEHLRRLGPPAEVAGVAGIVVDRSAMLTEFRKLLPYLRTIPFGAARTEGLRYAFDNPSYSWADGSVLHAMLRRHKPRRLIEVGSGWSSACAVDTIERDLNGQCQVTFIEPYPALLKALLGPTSVRMTILDKPIQRVPLSLFADLQAGDVLFIDSTHVAKTGSDVCYQLFDVLPILRPGVFVHIHDVFWPFEYPREWTLEENRSWNELYMLRAFLHGNADWRIVFFNHYMGLMAREEIAAAYPDFLRNSGGAIWLQRR